MLHFNALLALATSKLDQTFDVFPTPSIETPGNPIHRIDFFKATASATMGEIADAHAVHCIEASDGSFILVGKGVEREDDGTSEAFAVKLSAAGVYLLGESGAAPPSSTSSGVLSPAAATPGV